MNQNIYTRSIIKFNLHSNIRYSKCLDICYTISIINRIVDLTLLQIYTCNLVDITYFVGRYIRGSCFTVAEQRTADIFSE